MLDMIIEGVLDVFGELFRPAMNRFFRFFAREKNAKEKEDRPE